LTRENATLKSTVGSLTQRLDQLERLQTRSDAQGGLTREEEAQYREAAAALKRIFAADPELAALFEARKHLPSLAQGYQSVQQLTQAQARAQQSQARNHIEQLVKTAGIEVDKKHLPHVVRLVAGAAMGLPEGNERYDRGDLSVLDEAFTEVKEFIEAFRKGGTAQVVQTKDKLKKMPPAPRGGPAGTEAPKPIEPGQERAALADMHKRGLALLRERLTDK
jgi:hypothetical protein